MNLGIRHEIVSPPAGGEAISTITEIKKLTLVSVKVLHKY
jgi:hypothetical protein